MCWAPSGSFSMAAWRSERTLRRRGALAAFNAAMTAGECHALRPGSARASASYAEAPDHLPNRKKIRGLHWSGRLDLNRRPLAPQAMNEHRIRCQRFANSRKSSNRGDYDGPDVPTNQPVSRNFAANLLPPSRRSADELNGGIEQLLTVRQVAEHFGVCTATVYKWAAAGKLPHVRLVNVIRVRPQDLTRLLSLRPPPAALPPQSR